MSKSKKYRIVIADPSIIVSDGLERLLNTDPECDVIARFTDKGSLIDKNWQLKPDAILFNPILVSSHKRFPIKHLLKESPETTVIALLYSHVSADIISEFDESIDIFEKPEKIIQKIKAAFERNLPQAQQDQSNNDGQELSEREKEILISVAQGLTNKEIAERHNISIHTVISHRKNISRKTNIKTVSGLTVFAMLNNLLP